MITRHDIDLIKTLPDGQKKHAQNQSVLSIPDRVHTPHEPTDCVIRTIGY